MIYLKLTINVFLELWFQLLLIKMKNLDFKSGFEFVSDF